MMMTEARFYMTVALLLLLSCSCSCLAMDYSDLEGLGAACEGFDSCEHPKMSKDFSGRNCECDDDCATYGDCCIDARATPAKDDALLCMPYGTTPYWGAYVIRGCPPGSPSEGRCLNPDPTDPVVSAPVSVGGRHYFNAHCAECNGEDLTGLAAWTPLVACDTLAHYNLSAALVWAGLRLNGTDWVVPYKGQEHKCRVLYDKPRSAGGARLCRAGALSSCPHGYRRGAVRRMCEAYTAVVYAARAAYRNPHCALCNGVAIEELYCDAEEFLSGRNKFSVALLFDVGGSGGDEVGVVKPGGCSEGQMYDAFHKKCRDLVCGIPGQVLVDGKCQKTP